jgi:hypothetical protein
VAASTSCTCSSPEPTASTSSFNAKPLPSPCQTTTRSPVSPGRQQRCSGSTLFSDAAQPSSPCRSTRTSRHSVRLSCNRTVAAIAPPSMARRVSLLTRDVDPVDTVSTNLRSMPWMGPLENTSRAHRVAGVIQIVSVAVASIGIIAIFAQGALTRGTETVYMLEATFPSLPAILVAALATILAILFRAGRSSPNTATIVIIISAAALCIFANVHTQSLLLGWDHWGKSQEVPWWSNTTATWFTTGNG